MSFQEIIYTFVASFIALFPVMNPVGAGFMVNGFLEGVDEAHRKTYDRKIVLNTLMVGLGSLVAGHLILLIFGLAVPVIQVGGGFIICRTGLEWLSDSGMKSTHSKEKTISTIDTEDIGRKLFYPITFPVSIGPGTVSVIFTLMATSSVDGGLISRGVNYAIIAFTLTVLSLILYLFLVQGHRIIRKIGSSGSLVVNKLIAFITFCVGIQIIVTGIGKIFHLTVL